MARLALENGDLIRVQSETGEIVLPVRTEKSVTCGTVVVPHGLPDVNVNRLIASDPQFIEPISGMHQMVGHSVQIEKC